MVALYTDSIVSTSKHSKENHHETQDSHAVIVLAPPVNFGVGRTAFWASRSKESELSGPRHSNAINLARGVTRPNLKQCIRRAADSSLGLEPGQMNYVQRPLRKARRGGYTAVGLSR